VLDRVTHHLQTPSDQDLSGGLSSTSNDRLEKDIIEVLAAGKRAVGIENNASLLTPSNNVLVSAPWVKLHLVDTKNTSLALRLLSLPCLQLIKVLHLVVADTDALDLAGLNGFDHSLPGVKAGLGTSGTRVVDEVEVDVACDMWDQHAFLFHDVYAADRKMRLHTEVSNLLKSLSDSCLGLFVAEARGRNFGGEEELVAGDLGGDEACCGGLLITVRDGGVDVAVAVLDSNLDDLFSYIVGTEAISLCGFVV
jgi:hypothetical protein